MTKPAAMETSVRVIRIDPEIPDSEALDEAVAVLRGDGLVVAPTETRYGLLGRADHAQTIRKLFDVKARAAGAPTAVFVRSVADMARYAEVSPVAARLARRFLPGPLTLVLKAVKADQPHMKKGGKIGLRVSSAPVISRIMERVSFPVSATSANLSGDASQETVSQLAASLGNKVDLYLDGGRLAGPPSTVVDCTGERAKVLRSGVISDAEIMSAAERE